MEKVGSIWAKGEREVKEVEEKDGTRRLTEEVGGFGEDNIKECITKLARE